MSQLLQCPDCGNMFPDSYNFCSCCGRPASDCRPDDEATRISASEEDTHVAEPPSASAPARTSKNLKACPACGEAVARDAWRCPHCGAKIAAPMDLGDAVFDSMFRKTFTISGRSRRSEFFPYMVMLPPFALLLCGFLPVVGAIVFLILWIAPVVRRLHDIGRCGWWCLHPMSFFWFFKDSDPGTNDYGPSPKYQPEAFSHKPADKSREIALAWLAFLGVVLFITLIVIAVTFIR